MPLTLDLLGCVSYCGNQLMPHNDPVSILIVNEQAEEIKLATISLRGFFPDCRIDVAYSSADAVVMASLPGRDWSVILIDSDTLPGDASAFTDTLRRQVPYGAFLLQSSGSDAAAALQALHIGADYFLAKQSPAFLTELLFCVKEALDKRDLRLAADRTETRYRQLISSLGDAFYELDAEGRFLHANAALTSLLGYRPGELIGLPHSALLPHPDDDRTRFRLNERRSGHRATTGFPLTLLGKRAADGTNIVVTTEITARGLYDPAQRFLGTIGIIRDISERTKLQATIRDLQDQLQHTTELQTLTNQILALSKNLRSPLSTLLNESQDFIDLLRQTRVTERVDSLNQQAAAAAQLGAQLEKLVEGGLKGRIGPTVDQIIKEALDSLYPEGRAANYVETDFSASLPPFKGDREQARQFFHRLLAYAQAYLIATGRPAHLVIRTGNAGTASTIDRPTLFPLPPSTEVAVEIIESGRKESISIAATPAVEPIDLLSLYGLSKELGVVLDVSAPASGPLHIHVRLPLLAPTPSESAQAPVAPPSGIPPASEEAASVTDHAVTPPQPATADRRQTARVPTTLSAQITIGSSSWNGTIRNVGLGGACLDLPPHFPSIALQEAYVTARTTVGFLELGGLVYERPAPDVLIPTEATPRQLILVFHALKQTDSAVLASMIQAVKDQSLTFTLEILLIAGPLGTEPSGQTLPPDFDEPDRREAIRLPLTLPARLETEFRPDPVGRLTAQVVNISRAGACLLVMERPQQLEGTVTIHFAPANRNDHPSSHEPGPPETALSARIIWSASDPGAPSNLQVPDTGQAARVGVRFQSLSPYAERELFRLIRQSLSARSSGDLLPAPPNILSVARECRNARGQTIAITDSHLRESVGGNVPTVIIAPGYGQTALDYAPLAYYLAARGLRILRYDHTNHLGNSEGELQHITLRSMQHDLSKVVEFVRHTWPQTPVFVIASDLAARAGIKAAVQTGPFDLLILINPSVNVGETLMAVHGHDLVADYQFGLRRGISNLLGLNVNIDQFVSDLAAGHFSDLESTLEDLRLLRSPLSIVTSPAPSSASLPPADLPHRFLTALGATTKLFNVPTPLTGQEWLSSASPPASFEQILHQIASVLATSLPQPIHDASVLRELTHQQRVEQEHTRLRHDGTQIGRDALCAAHIEQLHDLGNLHQYRKVLDDLYGLMSPIDPGAILIDAGIGEKDVIRATLVNHTYRTSQTSWTGQPAPIMVGLERSSESILEARQAVFTLQRELSTGFAGRLAAMPPMTIAWVRADWTESLPFQDGSVHRMVSNLSVAYVRSPLAALRDWYRVLHPEGRLILTTFLPTTDLSSLYRSYLRQAHQDEFSDQAQPLLHYFGRLREGIGHRVLYVFDQTKLSALLKQCGITSFKILPIYDGQALAAVVRKRNSSSSIR